MKDVYGKTTKLKKLFEVELNSNNEVVCTFESDSSDMYLIPQEGNQIKNITKNDIIEFNKNEFTKYIVKNGKISGKKGFKKSELPETKSEVQLLRERIEKLEQTINDKV